MADVTAVPAGAAHPAGSVVVDEIGFHHATSVAEPRADRGCSVEIATPGMPVGQDLGITLDVENWCIRARAKGIVQTTAPVRRAHAAVVDGERAGLAVPTAAAGAAAR